VKRSAALVSAAAIVLIAAPVSVAIDGPAVTTVIPRLYKNCTNLNKKYPHGVGRLKARDRTSGTPVTTFRRSTRLFNIAMSHNRGLDRDRDGIACEKR
jgi:hypothetical protein